MGANKVVIDVEARFNDGISGPAKAASKAIDQIGKSAKEAQARLNTVKKKPYKPIFDADNSKFLKKLRDMEHKAVNLGKHKTAVVLEATDKATNVIGKVMNTAQKFGRGAYRGILTVKAVGLNVVSKALSGLRSITKRAWTTTLRVKDFITAPINKLKSSLFSIKTLIAAIAGGVAMKKLAIEPTKMYADYEDLVTQFGVLLGSQDAAKKRMESLVSFAGQTPFTRDEIFQASRILQTYTNGALATPDSTGGLKMIGDVAAATGEEYVRVATYFGQLYNEVKRGGKSMGEPLMRLREIGALSAENEDAIKRISEGSGTIEEKWAEIAQQFSKTDGMMEAMSDQMNNLLLGVKSFIKNNLLMKLGEGISASLKPILKDFRAWRSENSTLIAEWATRIKDIAQIVSGKILGGVKAIASTVDDITKTPEWAGDGLGGKAKLLWKGLVSDPLSEWWNNGGRGKTVAAAGKIGAATGGILSNALLGIFRGISGLTSGAGELAGAGMDAGASVAGAFVQGFIANFDGSAVAGAFKDAVSGVWDTLPWWGKAVAAGFIGSKVIGGATSLFGKASGFLGSAAAGTGLLGLGSKAAIALGGGELAGGASLGVGGLSALGLTGIAGGVIGGATAIKGGMDLYHGVKEGDNIKQASGMMKLGGVGAGALTGAAIGSFVPVLGTALGALIGAGVGGVASWIGSSKFEKSMKAADFASQEMKGAIKDGNKSAEELDATFRKVVAQNLDDHFGDIRLSMDEIARLSDQLVWGDDKATFEKFATAADDAKKSLVALNNAGKQTEKWMWKASLGVKFDETEQRDIKSSFQSYIDSAKGYIENQHYTFTAAVDVLFEPNTPGREGILDSGGKWYTQTEEKAQELGAELQEKIGTALKGDGIITDQEWEAIMHVQVQIDDITNQVSEAEEQARRMMMESMFKGGKLKLGNGSLDSTSYQRLMEMNSTNLGEKQSGYYEGAVQTLTGIVGNKDLSAADWRTQITDTFNAYKSQIAGLRGETLDFQVELISDTYAKELGDGAATKVRTALDDALKSHTDPMTWSLEDVKSMFGLTGEASGEVAGALQEMLSTAFGQVNPLEVDNSLLDSWLNFNPEDWDENLNPLDVKRTVNETLEPGDVSTENLTEGLGETTPELDPINAEQPVNVEVKPGEVSTENMTKDLQTETPELSPIEREQEVDVRFKPTLLDSTGMAYGLDGSGLTNLPTQTVTVPVNVETEIVNGSGDGAVGTDKLTEKLGFKEGRLDPKTVKVPVTVEPDITSGSGDLPSRLTGDFPDTVSKSIALDITADPVTVSGSGGEDLPARLAGDFPDTVTKTVSVDVTTNANVVNGSGDVASQVRDTVPDTVSKTVTVEVTAVPTVVNGSGDPGTLAKDNVPANVAANTAVRIAASYSVSPKLTDSRVKTLAGVKSSYSFSAKATLNVSWTVNGSPPKIGPNGGGFRGGIFGGSTSLSGFARGGLADSTRSIQRFSDGGIVRGGSRLIQVAEEGSPEMVIPLSSQRRERGRKLWEKAGEMLKVPGFARGGLTDKLPDSKADAFSLPNVWQTSSAMTDDRFGVRVEDDPIPRRERHPRAIPYNSPEEILQSGTRSTSEAAAGPGDVHVEMGGITVNLTIQVNGGGNVVEEIKAQMGEIRDAVADALTDSLGAGFANTPVKGGLAG